MVDVGALEFRQSLKILAMFLIVQFLGLFLAIQLYNGAQEVKLSSAQIGQTVNSAVIYMGGIIVFTAMLLILLRHLRSNRLFVVMEAFAVGGASFIVFLVFIGMLTNTLQQEVFGSSFTAYDAVALCMAALLILAKNRWPRLRNTASIIASAGLGFFIGVNLSFPAVYVFMVILAAYDFIAVFITKHMVVMGQAMAGMNLAFLVGASEAEAVPRRELSAEEAAKFRKHREAFGKQGALLRDLDRRGLVPIVGRRELGNGDLAVPLMAAVSVYQVTFSFVTSLVVIAGGTLGLVATLFILNRYRRALPAIPPLLAGITVALAAYSLIGGVKLL